jgi:transmembrane sensor
LVALPETQTLPDGTVVELKSGAKIVANYSDQFRRVLLEHGEAHFQVAHQSRPFVVTAGNVEFRAVGTAFNVQVAAAEVELLVTEGQVAVDKPAVASATEATAVPAASVAMTNLATIVAGNRVVVTRDSGDHTTALTPIVILPAEISERLAWRIPKLDFTDTALADAVALMNRHSQLKLVIEDAELGKLLVSGLFRADRSDAFVRLLEANFDVRARQVGETTHLYRKR